MELIWVISEVVFWAMCLTFVFALLVRMVCGTEPSNNKETMKKHYVGGHNEYL